LAEFDGSEPDVKPDMQRIPPPVELAQRDHQGDRATKQNRQTPDAEKEKRMEPNQIDHLIVRM
jgi:hypothetical protein